ncbi:MAG: transcription-repair coupling factor [Chloroflexota bacterium]|nr:transcription-repair coupling factor [Chloroflexota bacterium]
MTLRHLLPTLREDRAIVALIDALERGQAGVAVADLAATARPPVAATLVAALNRPTLVVTARADRAEALASALHEYLPLDREPILWPAPEALPYEQLPFDLETATTRVAILDRLLNWQATGGSAPVVVSSVHGLLQQVVGPAELRARTRKISIGDRINLSALVEWAIGVGYDPVPVVQDPGTVARRGGIVDLFPPGADYPVRIDLFGDEVEGIRRFAIGSQRTMDRLTSVTLLPPTELSLWRLQEAATELADLDIGGLRPEVATEWRRLLEQMASGRTPASVDLFAPYVLRQPSTVIDYFTPDDLIVMDEPGAVDLAASQLASQAAELEANFVANGELPSGLRRPYESWQAIRVRLGAMRRLTFGVSVPDEAVVALDNVVDPPNFAGRLTNLIDDVAERLQDNWRVVIATDQVDRLTEIFEESGIYPRQEKRRERAQEPVPLAPGTLEIRASDLDGGWMARAARTVVLSDLEVFGFRKLTRGRGRKTAAEAIAFAASLTPGEYVVHIDHGVGRFVGLVRLDASGVEREYMLLEYQRSDKLYVPVDQSDRVSRYSGGGLEPTLTRLGSGEWVQAKRRARRAVRELAFELVQIYAAREVAVGHAFPPDTTWDQELAESFPYATTPDQQRAIDDVRADMEAPDPMDRLVCGDVGYGKTEVAIRAAFKAVNDGRQVAILVPTTVLALQHYTTFTNRLAPFPVRVEMLSRLRTKHEQRAVVAGLADGQVDIVIGTHRLVQNDIKFKDLGLVVIDEEQRFGVRHKEFLKRLRTEVDVLTMSATPIPRTLHMAFAGIRDISLIETAPRARLPIRTFVTESRDRLIREVVLRELDRGGQIYFVHNRVHDIDRVVHRLRALVPEGRFGVGHGQMDEQVLEEVILGFVRHDYDVLVSTTIIESGIDIPNVNTIVINHADTLGLTQLYQLRGRVGRSAARAYAYLLYRPGKALSEIAQERLEAIQEATELGAGLRVAMRDMEIRGAGNILGAEQSGHIAEIGYELYIRLLGQAVDEIRSGKPVEEVGPVTLDLPLSALIPADYVVDTELRLTLYRRVAAVASMPELSAMRAELEDRFGPIPEPVEHLLALISLRLRVAELGIESIIEREREIVIRPIAAGHLERELRSKLGVAVKVTPNSIRVRLPDLTMPWQRALDTILDAIELTQRRAPSRNRVDAA